MAATISEVVARRIGEARAGAYSLRDLSRRLSDLGVDLNPNALNRIERGEREVKVKELAHIALALNVAPASLLVGDWDEPIAVTDEVTVEGGRLWWWVVGQEAIDGDEDRYRDNSRTDMFERYEAVMRQRTYLDVVRDLVNLARKGENDEALARSMEMLAAAEADYEEALKKMDDGYIVVEMSDDEDPIPMPDDVPARQDAERS